MGKSASRGSSGNGAAGDEARQRALQGIAVTLIGVLASIGVTVAFGVSGPWWLRIAVGGATALMLIALVGLLGRRTPLLTRLARWLMETPR